MVSWWDVAARRLVVIALLVNGGKANGAGGLVSLTGRTITTSANGIIMVRGNSGLACSIARGTELVSARRCLVDNCSVLFNFVDNVYTNGCSIASVLISSAFGVYPRTLTNLRAFAGGLRSLTRATSAGVILLVSTSRDRVPRSVGTIYEGMWLVLGGGLVPLIFQRKFLCVRLCGFDASIGGEGKNTFL